MSLQARKVIAFAAASIEQSRFPVLIA